MKAICHIILIVFSFLVHQETKAQDVATIQGIVLYHNKPLPFYKISFIGHGDVVTQSNGEFRLTINKENLSSEISIGLYDTLAILEPREGRIPAFTDQNYFHKIYLGTRQSRQVLQQYGPLIVEKITQIDNKASFQTEAILEAVRQNSQQLYQNLSDSITKMYDLKRELAQIIEMQKKNFREGKVLPALDSVYNIYLSRTKDLRDAMDQYGPGVFYSTIKTDLIQKRINGYNEAYESLITRKGFIINQTELYWNESVPFEVRNLIDNITLQNFHRNIVLTSNVSIINSILDFNSREKGRRKKSEIKNDIEKFVVQLNNGIEQIANEQNRVVQKMKAI